MKRGWMRNVVMLFTMATLALGMPVAAQDEEPEAPPEQEEQAEQPEEAPPE